MDVNILLNNGVNVNASLELLGDMEMYNETLAEFKKEVYTKLENIKKYKEIGDIPNYQILVHSLKSDSKYLGFTKLAELSYNHEMASKAGNVNYINQNYNQLMEEASRILRVVEAYCGNTRTQVTNTPIATKKILVADDSNIIRNIVQKTASADYEVLEAHDGAQAIEVIKKEYQNLVCLLLDLNMPNVDGFEVLSFFNNNNLFQRIPVTIITGDDSKETVMKAFNYPIVDVLNKPFNEKDVERVVNKMINFSSLK